PKKPRSSLFGSVAMRRVLVVLCVILALFGIPWLVNWLQGEDDKAQAPAGNAAGPLSSSQPALSAASAPQIVKAAEPRQPAAAKVVPVALQPSQGLPAAAALPANEPEL